MSKGQIKIKVMKDNTNNGLVLQRIMLYCINKKCMSGRIEWISSDSKFIEVNFIEPEYFNDVAKFGENITIQEASKVIAEGRIVGISI